MLNALQYASRSTLRNVHLKHSNTVLRSLQAIPDSQRDEWNDNGTYWDDWCLCKVSFLI